VPRLRLTNRAHTPLLAQEVPLDLVGVAVGRSLRQAGCRSRRSGVGPRPDSLAMMAAWTREVQPSLARTRDTCVLAVASVIPRRVARSALDSPRPRSASTSRSRAVNWSRSARGGSAAGLAATNALNTRRVTSGATTPSPAAT
jgi:hypothetical protein